MEATWHKQAGLTYVQLTLVIVQGGAASLLAFFSAAALNPPAPPAMPPSSFFASEATRDVWPLAPMAAGVLCPTAGILGARDGLMAPPPLAALDTTLAGVDAAAATPALLVIEDATPPAASDPAVFRRATGAGAAELWRSNKKAGE